MASSKHERSEFGTRAHAIYDAELRHKLEPHEHGRYLALEVETRDYDLGRRLS